MMPINQLKSIGYHAGRVTEPAGIFPTSYVVI
jgi:hypothetical protein